MFENKKLNVEIEEIRKRIKAIEKTLLHIEKNIDIDQGEQETEDLSLEEKKNLEENSNFGREGTQEKLNPRGLRNNPQWSNLSQEDKVLIINELKRIRQKNAELAKALNTEEGWKVILRSKKSGVENLQPDPVIDSIFNTSIYNDTMNSLKNDKLSSSDIGTVLLKLSEGR